MGYTHYWNQPNWGKEDKEGFKKAIPHILELEKDYGVLSSQADSEINNKVIWFTPYETFAIYNQKQGREDFGDFCKTGSSPLDPLCCKILLLLNHFCPNFNFHSDGLKRDAFDSVGMPIPHEGYKNHWLPNIDWFLEWEKKQEDA